MTNTYKNLHDPVEAAIIEATIEAIVLSNIIGEALKIGVHDGEATSCKADWPTPDHLARVRDAIAATDETTLVIRDKIDRIAGTIVLYHGNGEDVVSDYTATAEYRHVIEAITDAAHAVAYPAEAPAEADPDDAGMTP